MSELDLPTNQRHCDPELAGCGTIFSVTLDRCPHCQLNWGTEEFFTEDVELPDNDPPPRTTTE